MVERRPQGCDVHSVVGIEVVSELDEVVVGVAVRCLYSDNEVTGRVGEDGAGDFGNVGRGRSRSLNGNR